MTEPHFPKGPQAAQERYIEAFRGLTRILTIPGADIRGNPDHRYWHERWVEMFEVLAKDIANEAADD